MLIYLTAVFTFISYMLKHGHKCMFSKDMIAVRRVLAYN